MKKYYSLPDGELEVMQIIWQCEPLVSQKDYLAEESRRMLDKLYGGSLSAFAVALSDSGISKDDLDELRAMLEDNKL